MGCLHRERKLMHQYRINFSLYIYSLGNNFQHNSNKVLACDVKTFLLEIPIGPSMFLSKLGEP
jgi:hypothetical protein